MRRPRLRWSKGAGRALLASGSLLAGASGCALFMDLDVSGYTAEPGAVSDAGGCPSDASCVVLTCLEDKDCDAGAICCLDLTSISPVAVSATCHIASCPMPGVQLCKAGSSDCGDGGPPCTICSVGGIMLGMCVAPGFCPPAEAP